MEPDDHENPPLSNSDPSDTDDLMEVVYDELRRLAERLLQSERKGHTLQATALVHEAYVRLAGQSRVEWQNRAQFFSVAATAIRRILIDHARTRKRLKRGGGALRLTLSESIVSADDEGVDILDLDEAMARLAEFDARKARIVEMKYFGGLTTGEVAQVLGLSERMIRKDWALARAWLHRDLTGSNET